MIALNALRWSSPGVITVMFCMVGSVTGCGGQFNASVKGIVTLDGKAVPCGMVTYQPKGGGPIAYARIEQNGSYIVRTGREEGLSSGDYDVTVTANEPPAATQNGGGGPPPPGKAITPIRYRSKATSGLSFVVEPGDNEINLKLTSELGEADLEGGAVRDDPKEEGTA